MPRATNGHRADEMPCPVCDGSERRRRACRRSATSRTRCSKASGARPPPPRRTRHASRVRDNACMHARAPERTCPLRPKRTCIRSRTSACANAARPSAGRVRWRAEYGRGTHGVVTGHSRGARQAKRGGARCEEDAPQRGAAGAQTLQRYTRCGPRRPCRTVCHGTVPGAMVTYSMT